MATKFLGKFKELIGIEDVEDDDYVEVRNEVMERKSVEVRQPAYQSPSSPQLRPAESRPIETRPMETRQAEARPMDQRDKVIAMNKTLTAITSQFNIVMTEPKNFDECPRLVDNLKRREPIIINLEKIETDTARKIFDFLSGATYALNGNIQKIANNIFVFVPQNVNVSANNTEHKSIDFGGNKSPWRP
jgi:cell division inhibitor SepF